MTITQSFLALVSSRRSDTNELGSDEAEISPPSTQARAQTATYGLRANACWPRVVPPAVSRRIGRHRCASQTDSDAYERTQSNLG
jgi:hypothetical protein